MIKKLLIAVVLFFLFICPAESESPVPHTKSIDLYPVADTYVYEKSNAVPFSNMELRVGNQNTINFGNIKSVLKFDISAIPENAIINEARLYVYSFDTKPSWDIRSIQAYAAPENWSESSIDWSRLNDACAQIHESSLIAGLAGSSPDAYFWDITTIVQSWVNGEPNFGIVLQYDYKNFNEYITIYSSNNHIFKPYLNVSCILTDPLLSESSLPIETLKEANALTFNKPTVSESNVKIEKAEEPTNRVSLHHVEPTPLVAPSDLEDTLSNSLQITPQSNLPEITRHPQSQCNNPGTPVNFLVIASGKPPLLFQWQKNGVDIEGETSKSLTIEYSSEDDEGIFTCSVSNEAGNVISNGAELYVNDVAEIIEQPVSHSIVHGKPVTFSLATAGSGPLTYQWKKNHIIIHGATKDSHTIASVQKEDEGIYTCEVSNDFSNDISNDAILVVITPPTISRQPLSQIKNPGMPVTFSVTTSGTPPFSFQWLKDGTTIDGKTSESYTIDSVSENDEGIFTCNVINDAGSLTSNPGILTVNNSAKIIQQPLSFSKSAGESVTFSVEASGTEPLSFQWEKNHNIIPGATSKTYTIASVKKKDEGIYTCEVSNGFSNSVSNNAHLTLKIPLQIIQHPHSQLVNPETAVTFALIASGTPPLKFQWQKDGVDINGETSKRLTINSVSENDEGFYTCAVGNNAGVIISDDAELLINFPPQIKRHPESQLINPGSHVTFSITASGVPPLSFQWQKDGKDLNGATSDIYAIDSVSEKNEGFYSCSVNNSAGSVRSKDAELLLNFLPTEASVVTVPESAAPDTVSAVTPHKPAKTIKTKFPASADILKKEKSPITGIKKQSPFVFKRLFLKPPGDQELYAHNGDTLTYTGVVFPQATLVSANLEDDHGCTIRDVSRGLKIDRETGSISGSIFVGSFRGAETVHLRIAIQSPSNSRVFTGISNTLFLDQGHPTVQVTEPANHSNFNTSPIVIYGTASDDISGIAEVEISTNGGSTYCSVDIIRNNQWLYSFTPKKPETEYKIMVRSKDGVGLTTTSDCLTIYYSSSSASVRKIAKAPMRKFTDKNNGNTDKSPDDDGICTYRIISLSNNNFQATDVFTLKEPMAIIIKGYGGQVVTLRIIDPSIDKTLFELSDFIPPHKNKMWKWELSQTGTFQAALFVDGTFKDDIFFTIIQ